MPAGHLRRTTRALPILRCWSISIARRSAKTHARTKAKQLPDGRNDRGPLLYIEAAVLFSNSNQKVPRKPVTRAAIGIMKTSGRRKSHKSSWGQGTAAPAMPGSRDRADKARL